MFVYYLLIIFFDFLVIKKKHNEIKRYRHPHLVSLLGHTDLSSERPCLVYELMVQGSLRDRLDCNENTPPLSWQDRNRIAYETSCAIAYLHYPYPNAPLTVHLDIKSDNILLSNNYHSKLADFGLVRFLGNVNIAQTQAPAGTIGWYYAQ